MQVAYLKDTEELLIPRYPQATFTQIAKVCMSRHLLSMPRFWVIVSLTSVCSISGFMDCHSLLNHCARQFTMNVKLTIAMV